MQRVDFADGFGSARWLVTRYDDLVALFGDLRLSSELMAGLGADQPVESLPVETRALVRVSDLLGRAMANVDPPEHTRLRRLIVKAFSAQRMEAMRPRIAEMVGGWLAGVGDELDLMEQVARPLPVAVLCEVLGVSEEGLEAFRVASGVIGGYVDAGLAATIVDAVDAFEEHAAEMIAHKRAHPADDLLTALLDAQDGGERLTEGEVVSMLALLIFAGHETTVHLIAAGALLLLAHPGQRAAVTRPGSGLWPGLVDETLRLDGPANPGLPRLAVEPVTVGGVTIPAGAHVVLATASGNRDPRRWDRPDEFDPARPDAGAHLAFGKGIHYCVGARMAKIETEIALQHLFETFPRLRLAVRESSLSWRPGFVRSVGAVPLAVA